MRSIFRVLTPDDKNTSLSYCTKSRTSLSSLLHLHLLTKDHWVSMWGLWMVPQHNGAKQIKAL